MGGRPVGRGLFDVVDGPAGDDPAVRPNQLLAAALPHAPAAHPCVVEVCREALLTSIGLRSLVPGSPRLPRPAPGRAGRTATAPTAATARRGVH